MWFWPIFALMTGAAVFAVLWPLARARQFAPEREAELAVYRDQLAEIERDRARGLLAGAEADAARIEVSRRLLAAGEQSEPEPQAPGALARRRAAAVIALAGIPLLSIGIYAASGSPGLPDAPLAARLSKPPEQMDAAILVQRIESHLAQNPGDGRGWELLAPIYARMGRTGDAVRAHVKVLQLLGSTAAREADLGEALVADADGVVNAAAHEAFERAVAKDPDNTKALFFLALAAEQDGRGAEADARWRDLIEKAAPADPWRAAAERRRAPAIGQGSR